jgi:hypothetical protein
MGGSTLALTPRVAGLARYMGAPLSEDEILIEFRRFWWDTALSGGGGAEPWGARDDRILWGSDFPGEQKMILRHRPPVAWLADNVVAVSLDTIRWFDSHLGKVYQNNASQLENVRRKNVLALFESCGIRVFGSRFRTDH